MEVTKDLIQLQQSEEYDFSLQLLSHTTQKTEFLMQSSPAIINTIRRIIMDETPTIAPDTLVVQQNTSVMHDEMLAQRLGLIPLAVDPRHFDFADDNINENNTIVFTLHIKAAEKAINVFSGDLQFVPLGNQLQKHGNIRPIHEHIPIVKLGPGQEIKFELYCHKGVGKVHSKWCPVSVAFFKMLPIFKYQEQVATWNQRKLPSVQHIASKIKCPQKVFDDVENIKLEKCTLCRSCLDSGLQILLDDANYLFTIEPTGFLNGIQIMEEALNVLKVKSQLVVDGLV